MSKTYETSYAKNVANFEILLTQIQGFEGEYNPSWPALHLNNLSIQLNKARAALEDLNTQLSTQKATISARSAAFIALKRLATRVLGAAKALDIEPLEIGLLISLNQNIQGKRPTKAAIKSVATETGETLIKRHISSSRQSFDSILDNFNKLIKQLAAITNYIPNENELSVDGLESLYTDLLTKNSEVTFWNTNISNSRISRNTILFKEKDGLAALSKGVKNYVKSIYGSGDPRYKLISKISIRNT
jgi:hypothetical protein